MLEEKDGSSFLRQKLNISNLIFDISRLHQRLAVLLVLTNRVSTQSRHSWQNLKLVLVSLLAPPIVITVLFPSASILTTVVVPRLSVSGISSFCLSEELTAAQ